MRYRETGELHLDFHGSTAITINHVVKNFGREALRQLMETMAKQVYRSIYQQLQAGNTDELVEHWQYFFEREKGNFQITRHPDGRIELLVRECPAVRHLKRLGLEVSPDFCLQTKMINDAWSDGTPFSITTEKTGEGTCRQTIIPRRS